MIDNYNLSTTNITNKGKGDGVLYNYYMIKIMTMYNKSTSLKIKK